jgi:hypothetical protein
MNRIVIIGNGFDLAHGLKTSYRDFIEWIKLKIPENPDEYFEYVLINAVDPIFGTNKPEASSFFRRYYHESYNIDDFISRYERCKFVYKNKFLEHIIKENDLKNWVDIEEDKIINQPMLLSISLAFLQFSVGYYFCVYLARKAPFICRKINQFTS